MLQEFEGKTQEEAIDKAIEALNLDREDFDVEIIESMKGSFFKKGSVKIRVHVSEEEVESENPEPETEEESKLVAFLEELIEKMGFPGQASISAREEGKLTLHIDSEHANILIGKKGKNLDAIQVLLNVYAGKCGLDLRIIVDTEDYRNRREENLVRLAIKTAKQVRRSKGSRLLEPMNPFERRLIHTALNEMNDIDTKSEGDGLYKQVRIMYRGSDF